MLFKTIQDVTINQLNSAVVCNHDAHFPSCPCINFFSYRDFLPFLMTCASLKYVVLGYPSFYHFWSYSSSSTCSCSIISSFSYSLIFLFFLFSTADIFDISRYTDTNSTSWHASSCSGGWYGDYHAEQTNGSCIRVIMLSKGGHWTAPDRSKHDDIILSLKTYHILHPIQTIYKCINT